ncbi:MAG: aromatic ring-hydroxylating dioxygenase subunit alpha, partial [Chloroflexota bacterium]
LENDFFIDRAVQRTKTYSGIPEFWAQDAGVQLSMGRINDRTIEHLGTTDLGIIAARRALLHAAQDLRERGALPATVHHPELYRVRGAAVLIPDEVSWIDSTHEHRKVLAGVNHPGV